MTATTSSSGKLFNIPTVDISSYLKDANGPRSQEIVSQIRQACITSGFFQIVGHGIDGELQKTIIECARDLFHLPLEEKSKLQSGQGRGYELIGSQTLQPGMKADMKEVSFIGYSATSVSHHCQLTK
jgi:isopenicillin N synthase-like dioxygenase